MERALELDHEDWLPARGPIELTCRAELQLLIFGERRVSSWPRAGMLPRTAAGDSLAASFRFAPPLGSPFSQAIGEVAIGAARARDASFLSTHSSDPRMCPAYLTRRGVDTARHEPIVPRPVPDSAVDLDVAAVASGPLHVSEEPITVVAMRTRH